MSNNSKASLPSRPAKGLVDGSQWESHQPLNMVVFENGLVFVTSWDGDLIGSLDVGRRFYEQRELGLSS